MANASTRNAPIPKGEAEDGRPRTHFDYLLNAADSAASQDDPAKHGFREKRLALFEYVRGLEDGIARRERELNAATTELAKRATLSPEGLR